MNLQALVRPNIWNLVPYSSARSEFTGAASVFLDANENPFNNPYNRYPDPLQQEVKALIAQLRGVAAGQIFLGVGSDECIDVVYRTFCRPGVDNVVAMSPSYGMYEVCADINDVAYRKVLLDDDFQLDADRMLAAVDDCTKVIWICSPNNPTGNDIPRKTIDTIIRGFDGIVVLDEAYSDFSQLEAFRRHVEAYPNLIVLNTMSKAWASASLRLGMAFASPAIIELFNKVKYPYNINLLAQQRALEMLSDPLKVERWVAQIKQERAHMVPAIAELPICRHIYPTAANFILVKVTDTDAIYQYLVERGIIVRNRNRVELCEGCLRITIGTPAENNELLSALRQYR